MKAPHKKSAVKKPRAGSPRQQVRIIGGQWKRSTLPVADVDGLRPTPDRVRETVFNWLGQTLDGLTCWTPLPAAAPWAWRPLRAAPGG